MSRVGRKPIVVPAGVNVEISGVDVKVSGPKGEMALELPFGITAEMKAGEIEVVRADERKQTRALHGTYRAHIANMLEGVSRGFTKELEIQGVGYRAALQGDTLVLNLGFSHAIEYTVPPTVTAVVKDNTKLTLTSVDKQQVGLAAARIRNFSKAEPYKGKGVRYKGEHVRRKSGKTVA